MNLSVMLSEYRQRYDQYLTAVMRDRAEVCLGWRRRSEEPAIFAENRDLFTLAKITELRRELAEAPVDREADRAGVRRLLAFAADGFLLDRLREIDAEIARHADRAESIDDLRRERLARLLDAVRDLGAEGYPQLRAELRDLPLERLTAVAGTLLDQTEQAADRGVTSLLNRHLKISPAGADSADIERLDRAPTSAGFFQANARQRRFEDLLRGLGLRPDQQRGLRLVRLPAEPPSPLSRCLPVSLPDEVILGLGPGDGQWAERGFWRAAGTALSLGWTSERLPAEFRHVTEWGDRALEIAWGMLFEDLMREPAWLAETYGLVESADLRRSLASLRLLNLRRTAARFLWELRLYAGAPPTSTHHYADLASRALRLTPAADLLHREYLAGDTTPLFCADLLRAAAFHLLCREHLRSAFGSRWWESRRSRDLLADLWNAGQRYPVEQLATAAGLGHLDYDWLIDSLVSDSAS